MLAADLFTRLRSPGFCLLRDCTGGGGVLGGTGTYLSGHGTLMNCCHHLPTTIVTQNPSTKLTGIKLVKLLQWRTMLSNILQATKTTNIHLFGLKLFFKILRIKSQCFFSKVGFFACKSITQRHVFIFNFYKFAICLGLNKWFWMQEKRGHTIVVVR